MWGNSFIIPSHFLTLLWFPPRVFLICKVTPVLTCAFFHPPTHFRRSLFAHSTKSQTSLYVHLPRRCRAYWLRWDAVWNYARKNSCLAVVMQIQSVRLIFTCSIRTLAIKIWQNSNNNWNLWTIVNIFYNKLHFYYILLSFRFPILAKVERCHWAVISNLIKYPIYILSYNWKHYTEISFILIL